MAAGWIILAVVVAASLVARWLGARGGSVAVREERAFLLKAFAQLNDTVVVTDPDFVIRAWNGAAERMYGYQADEVIGKRVSDVIVTEIPGGGDTETLLRRMRDEKRVALVARRRRKNGSWFDADISITAVEDESGRVIGYVGVQRDVTERRLREEEIRAAHAQIELLTSRAPAGIIQTDARGKLVFLNEMICVLSGLPPERLMGSGWLDAVHPEDRGRVAAEWKASWAEGGAFRSEFRFGTGDDVAWVFATAMTLHDDKGDRAGMVGVVTDVTEARRMQERLSKAERLGSLGTLASGMAHEINNPLSCVMSSLSFASEELAARPELREEADALAEAGDAAKRVARIVGELQAFSEARNEVERLDLREAVKEALALVPEAEQKRARVVLDLGEVPPVEGSMRQAQRVLYHLLRNAFQAVPDERAGEGEVRAATRIAPDGRAVVEIGDDGRGIPAEHLHRIFDPFFTTRRVGEGTGLGLSVCHGLVSAMDGEMEVESAEGSGTTFRVLLPAARGDADARRSTAAGTVLA